jgi:hypothetical protein
MFRSSPTNTINATGLASVAVWADPHGDAQNSKKLKIHKKNITLFIPTSSSSNIIMRLFRVNPSLIGIPRFLPEQILYSTAPL